MEKAVSSVKGVTSCSVSLLTNSMGVEGTAPAAEIIRAVEAAGYGAEHKDRSSSKTAKGEAPSWANDEALKDRETPKLKKRLAFSIPILLILMYFSMGHMMWGLPAPAAFDNHVFLGLFELILAITVMIINGKFFTSGLYFLPDSTSLTMRSCSKGFLPELE